MSAEMEKGAALPPLGHMDVWHEENERGETSVLLIVFAAMAASAILGGAVIWAVFGGGLP